MKSKKETRGAPPKYKNVSEIKELIDNYFKECEGEPFLNEDGQPLTTEKGVVIYKKSPKPPTVTGLALALGKRKEAER